MLKRYLSAVLSFVIMINVFSAVTVIVNAEDSNNLPFVFEDTDYGVADDNVVAKKISITDKKTSFVCCYESHHNEYSHGSGYVLLKREISDSEYMYYLVSKHGFVKSYKADGDKKADVFLPIGIDNYLEYYPDELYVIYNPETEKYDLYNSTTNKYYPYEADYIEAPINAHSKASFTFNGRNYSKGLLLICKNGKCGLLNNKGEVLYDTVFDKFDAFENCIVGKTDERYTILNKNGTSDVDINYKDLLIDYNYYIVYGVVNDNDECAFISVDDLKKITIFGSYYFKNSSTDRYDPRLFKRNDKYYILAYKNDEKYYYHPYIISDEKTICVNELLNSEVLRLVDRTDSSIGFETDEEVYDERIKSYLSVKSWISPDGKIICKKDTNYETESCTNGYLVTNEQFFIFGGKKYIKDSSGKEIAVADEIKKDGNLLHIYNNYSEDQEEYLEHSCFSCTQGKIIVEDIKGGYSQSKMKLSIAYKDNDKSFAILDSERGIVSDFYNAADFGIDKIDSLSFGYSRKLCYNEKNKNQYVFQINIGDSENEKSLIFNSDFKIIDSGVDLQNIKSGLVPYVMSSSYSDLHITDFNGNKILDIDNNFYNDYEYHDAVVTKQTDEYTRYGLISDRGEVLLKNNCTGISRFRNGVAYYEQGDNSGLVNYDGDLLVDGEFNHHILWWMTQDDGCEIPNIIKYPTISLGYENDVYIYDYSKSGNTDEEDESVPPSIVSGSLYKAPGKAEDKIDGIETNLNSDWFFNDSKKYDNNISKLSSQLIYQGYFKNEAALKLALKSLDFKVDKKYIDLDTGRDEMNHFIASKKISKNDNVYNLVVVGCIGSHKEQWNSNFDPDATQSNADYSDTEAYRRTNHLGFNDAKNYIKNLLNNYIKKKGYDLSNTKILLTGHSRGAATANLLGAELIRKEDIVKAENLYTYTFATPNVTKNSTKNNSEYDSIINIVLPTDFVTKVLPASWGYGRYGKTYSLPTKTNDSNYVALKNKMLKHYNVLNTASSGNTKFNDYALGDFDVYTVIKQFSLSVDGLNDYYNKKFNLADGIQLTPYEYFQEGLCPFVNGAEDTSEALFIMGAPVVGDSFLYKRFSLFFSVNHELSPKFDDAHKMETYCAFVMGLDSNEITQPRKSFLGSVNCPVDIEIYNKETKELVGKIVNNTVDKEIAEKDNSVVMTVDGDEKGFWMPSNDSYEVRLIGNDTGIMDYSVEEIDSDLGETSRINFNNIEVDKDKAYTDQFSEERSISDDAYITDDEENKIKAHEVFSEDDKIEYKIKTVVEGDGYATESLTVVSGDYVTLTATPADSNFIGWYKDDTLVSNETEYRFRPTENITLTAKFTATTNPTPTKPDSQKSVVKSKKNNPIKIVSKAKTVKAKKLKLKKQTIKLITITNAKGKIIISLVKSGITKKIRKLVKITTKGVITIKKWKKAKKGTYKIKIKITAAGNSKYKSKTVTKTVKVRIK